MKTLFLCCCCIMIWGQVRGVSDSELIKPQRIGAEFVFDGIISAGEWDDIESLDLLMQIPNFEEQPSEESIVKLAYDNQYIYLSGSLFVTDSINIQGNSLKRDALVGNTDFFGLSIDSYNDKENALCFYTTPTGLRWDGAISNDAVGSSPFNISWNNFWDVMTSRDSKGWYVEMRIPFSSLQFEVSDEKIIMGISSFRYIASKNEVDIYPAIPKDYGDWSAFKPSLFAEFVFEDVEQNKPFYITPYLLAGHSESNILSDDESIYENQEGRITEFGLDMKYGINNNLTLDLSYNTDFAQVEADDQQVNLTRFSLFFPEKRLFFQERSGVFDFNFGRSDKIFYSRRIGIDGDGRQVPIYGGARMVGRAGKWDMGFLSMQTEGLEELESENNTVFRLKRNIINENSDAGLILTNRTDFEGNYNTTLGLDATIRVFGDYNLSLRWAQTFSNEVPDLASLLETARWWVSLSSQSQRGFSQGSSISRSGKYFDPVLGFNVRDNFFRVGNRTQYNWFLGSESFIFSHGYTSGGSIHWNGDDQKVESFNWRGGWQLQTKSGWTFTILFQPYYERLTEEFELSDDSVVPVGSYDFYNGKVEIQSTFSLPLNALFSTEIGSFYDGNKTTYRFDPMYSISKHFELGGTYEYNNIQFSERNQSFIVHIARAKMLYMFSTKLSIAAFLQYNSAIKSYQGNVRIRYNPKEGNDLYIVYNGDSNYDLNRERPTLPNFSERSILLKYSYTFRL